MGNLSHEDESDLIWFFNQGQVAFERSTFGYQLERAELFTFGTKVCRKCKGRGFVEDQEKSIRRAIANLETWRQTTEDGKKRRDRLPDNYDDGTCRVCNGNGRLPRVSRFRRNGPETARPTTQAAHSAPTEPNTDALERYGAVSSRLRRVAPVHRRILEAFLGVVGGAWSDDPNRGRIWGVMPLTPAGEKLVKSHRGKGENMLPPDYAIDTAATLQLVNKLPNRGKLLETAKAQAEALYETACEAWAATDKPKGRKVEPVGKSFNERLREARELVARLGAA